MSDSSRVRVLDSRPNLGALYARSVVTGITGGEQLPDLELVLPDLEVDRGRLADYDRVCGFRLRDALPSTYPHVLCFPLAVQLMSEPAFPFALPGLVHIANRIIQHRPVLADEPLTLRVRANDLRPHPKGRQFDIVAEARRDDQVVWEGASTYLRRGGGDGASTESPAGPAPRDGPEVDTPRVIWEVPADAGRRYAAVSGDRNPIHLHPLTARLFGFPRQIAHGMWTKARCLAALEGRLPDSLRVAVAFKKPLVLPGRVAFVDRGDGDDWRFAARDPGSGKPYLFGEVSPR